MRRENPKYRKIIVKGVNTFISTLTKQSFLLQKHMKLKEEVDNTITKKCSAILRDNGLDIFIDVVYATLVYLASVKDVIWINVRGNKVPVDMYYEPMLKYLNRFGVNFVERYSLSIKYSKVEAHRNDLKEIWKVVGKERGLVFLKKLNQNIILTESSFNKNWTVIKKECGYE